MPKIPKTASFFGKFWIFLKILDFLNNQPFGNWMYDADNYRSRLSVDDIKHDFCNSTVDFKLKWTK
jgi:hypothetical protein